MPQQTKSIATVRYSKEGTNYTKIIPDIDNAASVEREMIMKHHIGRSQISAIEFKRIPVFR